MSKKQRPVLAGLMAILVFGLSACGAGADRASAHQEGKGRGSGHAQPRTDTVTGLQEAVRHVTRKTAKGTRPHLVKKCTTGTRKVKHTERRGSGSKKKTHTRYTTERFRDCKKVRKGTETYTKVVRQERWCVKLDDVNGKSARDDVWYRVSRATYGTLREQDEREKVTFEPSGTGC